MAEYDYVALIGRLNEEMAKLRTELAKLKGTGMHDLYSDMQEQFLEMRKALIDAKAENKRLKEALVALKSLTHYHYKVCNIDDQSEDEIAEFIEQTLKGG